MSSAGGSSAHMSFHAGPDSWVRCAAYPDQVPILSLDTVAISVLITPKGRAVTDEALEFARALVREVGRFAAEVERLHAARLTGDGPAADGDSAASCSTATDSKVA